MRILVVDDHLETAVAMARLLRHEGHAVATAGTVSDALAVARQMSRIDLLLSDLELPDGDGCALLAALRQQHAGDPANAIAMSGHEESSWPANCRTAGYGLFLVKPVVFEQLLAVIRRLLPQPDATAPATPALT